MLARRGAEGRSGGRSMRPSISSAGAPEAPTGESSREASYEGSFLRVPRRVAMKAAYKGSQTEWLL